MFSVVIPLYNKELSIVNTINSVLAQTNQNFEVIVVDDGSTDSSAKQVRGIDDSRIKLIQQKNQGVSAARNLGIKQARYEWVALLDGDDLWKNNHLSEIERLIKQYPEGKIFGTSFDYSDGRPIATPEKAQSSYQITNYFIEAAKYIVLSSSTVVINRSCFDKVGFFNTNLTHGEDVEMWARLGKVYNIIKTPTKTAIYRVDAENRTTLCKDLNHLHVYHFNLEDYDSIEERVYYEKLILNHMLQYFLNHDYLNFFNLMSRHKSLTFLSFLKYSSKKLTPIITRKILKILTKPYKTT